MAIKRKGRRPLCDCHHLPMRKSGRNPRDRRKFQYSCVIERRYKDQRVRAKWLAAGFCRECGTRPLERGNKCERCYQMQLLRSAKRTYAKYERLLKLDMDDPEYFEIVTGGRIA